MDKEKTTIEKVIRINMIKLNLTFSDLERMFNLKYNTVKRKIREDDFSEVERHGMKQLGLTNEV